MPIAAEMDPDATPEVDREVRARLEAELEHLETLGGEADEEPSTTPEEDDREHEGPLARAEAEAEADGLAEEGTRTSAASDMFERLNTPTARFGRVRPKPAVRPCGVTSTLGGSEKPSSGMRSLIVSTKDRNPRRRCRP